MGSLRDLRHLDKEFKYLKINQKKIIKIKTEEKIQWK